MLQRNGVPAGRDSGFQLLVLMGKLAGEYTLAQECWQMSPPRDLWPETKMAGEPRVSTPTTVWAVGYRDVIVQPGEARWPERVSRSSTLHVPGRTAVESSPSFTTLEAVAPGSWEHGELMDRALHLWFLFSCDSSHPGPSGPSPALCIFPSHGRPAPRPAMTRALGRPSLVCFLMAPENLSLLYAMNLILSNSLIISLL